VFRGNHNFHSLAIHHIVFIGAYIKAEFVAQARTAAAFNGYAQVKPFIQAFMFLDFFDLPGRPFGQ
jgi:hypothetical protein